MSQNTLPLPLAEKTNIKDWGLQNYDLKNIEPPQIDIDAYLPKEVDNAIIICDGTIVHQTLPAQVTVGNLQDDKIEEKNILIALNKKNKNSSLSLNISKNTKLDTPLYVVYIAKNRSFVHQTEITVEAGAEADIIEKFVANTKVNINIVSKLNILANAKVNAAVINALGGGSTVYYHRTTQVGDHASIHANNFIINDSNLVVEDFTHLSGKGSEGNVATVALANQAQQQNITIRVENYAPHAIGNIVNYGIVKDNAHLAFNGVGKIHKGMNGGDNQQESRLLNLSKTAEAIANPFLLIDEGDITAGHAASIGQIDEEQVYYLMSRGLSKAEAAKLIVSGFLTPFVNRLNNEFLKEELLKNIEEKLS